MSYCNSSILFLQCSATVQGSQDMHGQKIRRAVFLHISIRLPKQLFALRTFFLQMPSLQITNLTHMHTRMLDQAAPTGHHSGNMSPRMWRFVKNSQFRFCVFHVSIPTTVSIPA